VSGQEPVGRLQNLGRSTTVAKVAIHQFKAIERLELDIGRIAVIVGRNASGKSSVLQAIEGVLKASHAPQSNKLASFLPPAFLGGRRMDSKDSRVAYREGSNSAEIAWSKAGQPTVTSSGTLPRPVLFAPERSSLLRPVPLRLTPMMDSSGLGLADGRATLTDERKAAAAAAAGMTTSVNGDRSGPSECGSFRSVGLSSVERWATSRDRVTPRGNVADRDLGSASTRSQYSGAPSRSAPACARGACRHPFDGSDA